VLFLFAVVAMVAFLNSCKPPASAHEAAAESAFAAELQACVAQYARDVDIDHCAERVRQRWASDAGAEGGAR
jgi:hypothetical protein